mmetsp:Transcript_31988/g.57832  ORF Transcript_31988/g.57832 Transcript_31988/m.57832 type:complete len:302 (+) Transcript_31988:540-1445(+)
MGLDLDDLSPRNLISSSVANGLLVLLNGRAVHNSSRSNTNVIVLGEDPSIEVRGDIISNIHLRHLLVKLHLLLRDLNTFLERNRKVVFSSIHRLGNPRVSAISTNNQIDIHILRRTGTLALFICLVVNGVLIIARLVILRNINASDKASDGHGTKGDSTIAEELVHDLATAHANVFVGLKGVADVDFDAGGRDEFHAAHLTVHSRLRKIKLSNHAERNGSTTRLGIVHLPLEHDRIDILVLRKYFRSACSGRSSANDGHLVLHVERRGGSNLVGDSTIDEGGGGEGCGGADEEGGDGELHD